VLFLVVATSVFSLIYTMIRSDWNDYLLVEKKGLAEHLLLPLFVFAYVGSINSLNLISRSDIVFQLRE
jgi:UDP-N-acetylmuramyl pentapeptide phosphotransferase/UDP-N-acetylglucosamine-1-phosphate transferase